MIIVILIGGAIALFAAGVVAGRYGSWFGVAVPIGLTFVLGTGWEWDPDAIPLIIASAVVSGLGFLMGIVARRKRRLEITAA